MLIVLWGRSRELGVEAEKGAGEKVIAMPDKGLCINWEVCRDILKF